LKSKINTRILLSSKFLYRLTLPVIGRFFLQCPLSNVHTSLDARKICVNLYAFGMIFIISGPQASSGKHAYCIFMVKIAASEKLKRVAGRIPGISNFT
jgi:hypothetical protein